MRPAGWVAFPSALVLVSVLFFPAASALVVPEVGDLAGDALQSRLMLSGRSFLTGHHSDVGVSHPGPAGLLVKAVAEFAGSYGLFASVYGASLFLLLLLKALLLTWSYRVVREGSGSSAAAAAFLLVVLALSADASTDAFSVWLHFLAVWGVPSVVASVVWLSRAPAAASALLSFSAGLVAHLHASALPVMGPLVLLGMVMAYRARRAAGRSSSAGEVWGWVFLVPLVLRAVSEFPWPLSYVAAASGRLADRGAAPVEMPWLYSLGAFSGLSPVLGFATMVVAFCAGSWWLWRSRTVSAAALLWLSASGALFSLTSFQDQLFASELLWVAGLVWGLSSSGVALLAGWVTGRFRTFDAAAAGAMGVACMVYLASFSFDLRDMDEAGLHGGMDFGYVPAAADAFVSSGASGLRMGSVDTVSVMAGVLLELDRRGVMPCVAYADRDTEMVRTFVSSRRCLGGDAVLVVEFGLPSTLAQFEYSPSGGSPTDGSPLRQSFWFREEICGSDVSVRQGWCSGSTSHDGRSGGG